MIIRKETGDGLLGFRIGKEGGTRGREEALQEECCGDLVDDVFSVQAGGAAGGTGRVAGEIEKGVGVAGGQAFVKEMVGEGGVGLLQSVREGEGLRGLGAR